MIMKQKKDYITVNNTKVQFNQIWNIYEEAFPEDERRSLEQQKEILKNTRYELRPLYDKHRILGFIATWDLDDFIFIEHYAIFNKCRGQGYGTTFLKSFLEEADKNVVLEAEKPVNIIANKRIEFYQDLGFYCNPFDYIQPPYEEGKESVPLLILTYPDAIDKEMFSRIRKRLYKEVYRDKGTGSLSHS